MVRGQGARPLRDLYYFLIESPWPQLIASVAVGFVAANALFALAYLAGGGDIENARPGSFADAFFFSVQTMATIGYGKMAPRTLYANVLVAVEAMTGLLGLAIVTGLIFAKFARPTARVLFSRVAVVAPRDGIPSLMFRMANERGNQIVEAQIHVVLTRLETTAEGEEVRRFHDLELVRARSALFMLTWTAVHPITERSPLYGMTGATLEATEAEVVVSLTGLDETLSQTVHARHAYAPEEILWGARFANVLTKLPDGGRQVDYSRFHDVIPPG